MPSFANVPRPAAPENKVAVADLFQIKTTANAPAGSEEITHLGTFLRDLPASPPKAPSPGTRISQDVGDGDDGPAPAARSVVREITARSPRLRAIISREADAFIAQNLDSSESTVAVFATKRLKIPVGMVTIEAGPKVKIFDPESSSRKIETGLAEGNVKSVFVESQPQLDKLVKCLDGQIGVSGRTSLKLEAIVVPNDSQFKIPERHAHLIKSLESYVPGNEREDLEPKRPDRLAQAALENPLNALTAPGSDDAKTQLRLSIKDSRAARLGLDIAQSGNLLELAAAEVFSASLKLDRPISSQKDQKSSAVHAEPEAAWTVFDQDLKPASNQSEPRAKHIEAASVFGHIDLESTETPLKAHDPTALAVEVPADILHTTTLPAAGRIELKRQVESNSVGANITSELLENLIELGEPKNEAFVGMADRAFSPEHLEKLENSGALGKIAALAITTENEIQAVGNKPSDEVLAQKRLLDAMSPTLRRELEKLIEDVTGVTTIIFAPREAIVSEPQAEMDFSGMLTESTAPKMMPRGQILSIGDVFGGREQSQPAEQLEVAA